MALKSGFKSSHAPESGSLMSDWLTLLGVGHTLPYTRSKEKAIPFKSWFGLSRALSDYGVDSAAWHLADKSQVGKLPLPFIAHTGGEEGGNIIVTAIDGQAVSYLSLGEEKTTTLPRFVSAWDGNVFLSSPRQGAAEPDLKLHRRLDFLNSSKKWVMLFCFACLFVYAFVANGLYRDVAAYFLAAIDLGGIYVTFLLVQKSLHIHSKKADRFCGVLQEGGCDDVLSTSASKFFGLFGWSEVGFSYFSVSLLAMLLFPSSLPSLALCNLCCLPFTFWSIWYQKFRAKRWCTLCVTVQSSLWLLFFAYLAGGWIKKAFPIRIDFFVIGFSYVAVMLLINAVMPYVKGNNAGSPNSDKI